MACSDLIASIIRAQPFFGAWCSWDMAKSEDISFYWGNGRAWPTEEQFRREYLGEFTARALKPEYQVLSDEFEARNDSCSCHLNPPCSWCTDEGNPENLHNNDNAWEPYP